MIVVSLTEFRRRLSHFVERVKLGETFIISEREVAIAKIIPLKKEEIKELHTRAKTA